MKLFHFAFHQDKCITLITLCPKNIKMNFNTEKKKNMLNRRGAFK